MSDTTCHMLISLDGFVAGPDHSREDPFGKRGKKLHGWHLGDERANEADETATGWLMRTTRRDRSGRRPSLVPRSMSPRPISLPSFELIRHYTLEESDGYMHFALELRIYLY
jgi:hypothetical protein